MLGRPHVIPQAIDERADREVRHLVSRLNQVADEHEHIEAGREIIEGRGRRA